MQKMDGTGAGVPILREAYRRFLGPVSCSLMDMKWKVEIGRNYE